MEMTKQLNYDSAPTYGSIKGTIQIHRNQYGDDDVLTLCCLKVTLLDADNHWVAEEYTDYNGEFAFLGFALKTYTVVFPESIDYRKQKFLPEGSGFKYQFPVTLSAEQTRVNDVDIHYGLPQTGLIQGYTPNADTQPILGFNA